MKSAKIFLVEGKRTLVPMVETSYVTEDDLQALLVDYPDLLPGEQISPEDPRRWLLVAREMSVPGGQFENGRWSLDHLFLDQDGIPTFVECKRSSDTRTRREVVAQMLDYAANGIVYWTMDALRQAATETCRDMGKKLDDEILALIDSTDQTKVKEFWEQVEQNLRSGKVRLVFVADNIPSELRRLVEFLNEKMSDVEVLAVEVKQFLGEQQKAIVPRVIGITETARDIKQRSTSSGRHTNRDEFLSKLSPEIADFFAEILDDAEKKELQIYWGTAGFSIRAYIPLLRNYASIIYGYPSGIFQVYFGHLSIGDLTIGESEIASMRKEILKIGKFREAPKTLTLPLDKSNLMTARKAYDMMVAQIEPFRKQ
jgi:ribosomal protein L7Ae-like RNA K-turn-binding protein